jgi:hypothetical protein
MRSKSAVIVLIVAAIFVFWTVTYSQKSVVKDNDVWEYTESGCSVYEANKLGAEGWELVVFSSPSMSQGTSNGCGSYVYKRVKH